MKRAIALIVLVMFLFISSISFADEGSAAKRESGFEKVRQCIESWGKPSTEKVETVKEAAAPLTAEELKARRQSTGVGMRGIIGNE